MGKFSPDLTYTYPVMRKQFRANVETIQQKTDHISQNPQRTFRNVIQYYHIITRKFGIAMHLLDNKHIQTFSR